MAIRRKTSPTPEVPLTSTADVAFLLLIFFLVAASNTSDRGAAFDPPGSEQARREQSDGNLELLIKPDGVWVGKEPLPPAMNLSTVVRGKLAGTTDPARRVVLISADETVSYQRWNDVVAAVEAGGGIPAPQIEQDAPGDDQ